jgi:hypothetical protein
MGSFHLYPLSILFFRIKSVIHGLNLEREEAVLEGCGLCTRTVIYYRQSELSLENNVLKVIFVMAGIVGGVARGIGHNGKESCRTVRKEKEVGADLNDARVRIGLRGMIGYV